MDPLTIYINPRCSKSRAAVQLLDDHNASFEAINYLETPPDGETIGRLVDLIEGELRSGRYVAREVAARRP